MDERSLIRYLRTRTKTGEGRRWRCPDESQLAAYADGQVGDPARKKIEAHLADCEFCLDQVAFLARIAKAELPDSVPTSLLSRARDLANPRIKTPLMPAWSRIAAAAAVACLAVVVTVSVRRSRITPPSPSTPSAGMPSNARPVTPGSSTQANAVRGETQNGSLTVLFPAADSVVPRKDLQLRWQAVDGALYYDVRVMTAEGNLAWEQQANADFLKVPADVKLEAGRKYYVLIRADLPEGKTSESKAVAFRVADQH